MIIINSHIIIINMCEPFSLGYRYSVILTCVLEIAAAVRGNEALSCARPTGQPIEVCGRKASLSEMFPGGNIYSHGHMYILTLHNYIIPEK